MATTAPLPLHAGPLRTTLHEGRLGPIFVDGHEAWHGVHFLLRDPHWRTPALRLGAPRRETLAGGWRLVVDGRFDSDPAVALRLSVEGGDDGTLAITGEAWPGADIAVNRLGLCLLHPLDCAGRELEVVHDDGRRSLSTFPTLVPPWPPFLAIRALRHPLAPGVLAVAEFEGDSFEFEDQRNNADASFKTYSRSNFMPRPYRLRAGEAVRQRLLLRVEGRPSALRPAPPRRAPEVVVPLPDTLRTGIELELSDLARPDEALARVADLRPDHLHLALPARGPLPDDAVLARLLAAGGAALRLDLLDLEPAAAPATLARLAGALHAAGIEVADLAVFPTTPEAVAAARAAFPRTRIGGGTPDFFVQLNRLDALPALDFLSFTVCPIVHAADDDSLIEGRRSLQGMLDTLRHRHPGLPVQLGPSRIAARRSPLGERAASDGSRGVPLAGVDPREQADFGAGWIATHIAAAALAGAETLTVAAVSLCGAGSSLQPLLAALGRRERPGGVWALLEAGDPTPVGLRVTGGAGVREWRLRSAGPGPAPG